MAKRINALEQMKKWMEVIPQCLQTEKQRTFEDEVISHELEMTKREFEKQGFIPPEFKNEEEMCDWLSAVAELHHHVVTQNSKGYLKVRQETGWRKEALLRKAYSTRYDCHNHTVLPEVR
ncbi:hypothetical protein WMR74_003504 [Providencia rettgeri]